MNFYCTRSRGEIVGVGDGMEWDELEEKRAMKGSFLLRILSLTLYRLAHTKRINNNKGIQYRKEVSCLAVY